MGRTKCCRCIHVPVRSSDGTSGVLADLYDQIPHPIVCVCLTADRNCRPETRGLRTPGMLAHPPAYVDHSIELMGCTESSRGLSGIVRSRCLRASRMLTCRSIAHPWELVLRTILRRFPLESKICTQRTAYMTALWHKNIDHPILFMRGTDPARPAREIKIAALRRTPVLYAQPADNIDHERGSMIFTESSSPSGGVEDT